jgi:hypothetical protein
MRFLTTNATPHSHHQLFPTTAPTPSCFEQTSATTFPLAMALQYYKTHVGTAPDIVSRAEGLLRKGVEKLVAFETPEKGCGPNCVWVWRACVLCPPSPVLHCTLLNCTGAPDTQEAFKIYLVQHTASSTCFGRGGFRNVYVCTPSMCRMLCAVGGQLLSYTLHTHNPPHESLHFGSPCFSIFELFYSMLFNFSVLSFLFSGLSGLVVHPATKL